MHKRNPSRTMKRSDTERAEWVERTLEVRRLRRTGDTRRIAQLLEHGVLESATRESAIAALGVLRSKAHIPLLLRLFDESDESTRLSIVIALREIASPEAVPTLVRGLTDIDVIAWTAADALGRIGDRRAYGPLADALEGHNHRSVRRTAAEALAKIGGRDAAQILSAAAKRERHPLHRRRMRRLAKEAGSSESPDPNH